MIKQSEIILAALRHFQQAIASGDDLSRYSDIVNVDAITPQDIDVACERINLGDDPLRLMIHLEGGLVQSVFNNREPVEHVDIVVLDYDTEGADTSELINVEQSDGTIYPALGHRHALAGQSAVDLDAVAKSIEALEAGL